MKEELTILDQFAIGALAAISDRNRNGSFSDRSIMIAEEAYKIANAMLHVKQKIEKSIENW